MSASEYILSKIESFGDSTAQIDVETQKWITFSGIQNKSKELARWLRAQGLGRGNIVGLMSRNNVDFVWILLGIMESGAACHVIDPSYTLREVIHAHRTAPVNALVLQKGTIDPQADPEMAEIKIIVEFDDEGLHRRTTGPPHKSKSGNYSRIWGKLALDKDGGNRYGTGGKLDFKGEAGRPIKHVNLSDDVALIMRSSGTTGLPKGVIYSHGNLLAAMHLRHPRIGKNETALGLLQFNFAYGLSVMLECLCEGALMVVMSRFSLSAWTETIKKYSVSRLYLVPSLVATLLKSDRIDFRDFISVSHLYISSAPVSEDNLKTLKSKFLQPILIHNLYGLTESAIYVFARDMNGARPASLGKPIESFQAKVINVESGKILGPKKVGEICIKGPAVTPGYFNNPEATAQAFYADGWYRTGDLGYFDPDGFFYFVERRKLLIKYQGHQVSPSELEFVLISHPHIEEAAVVGIDHEIFGQVPRAFVVLRKNSDITAQEIHDYMRGVVAPAKLLRGGLVFISSIPKTSSGKIQRSSLFTMPVKKVHYDKNITNDVTLNGFTSVKL